MRIAGRSWRTLRGDRRRGVVEIIDQTRLPHELATVELASLDAAAHAIRTMQVRGAPLIGVTAAYGAALALVADGSEGALVAACERLAATRPTAVNLRWALERMLRALAGVPAGERAARAWDEATAIAEEDVRANRAIGEHGATLLAARHRQTGRAVEVLTHCNAGWLATVDWGTALAPVYVAHDAGVPVHVWVDETRPRNQGLLTAWELGEHGVPHTLVADNAGGHLMQRGRVDLVLVGADRVTRRGDVGNKIGTYLKALAARDCGVPFYAAFPASTVDWTVDDGLTGIPIEERDGDELRVVAGLDEAGRPARVRIAPAARAVGNPAFDVTPARLVTGLVTERGACAASEPAMRRLMRPERDEHEAVGGLA